MCARRVASQDLLTLSEAHAALRHLLCGTDAAPQEGEAGWLELRRLISIARTAGCTDEVHFFPLERIER